MRPGGLSKSLRDDYTAFSLAAINSSMLYATVQGLSNQQVADFAERHLTADAGAIERINNVMSGVVNRDLAMDGHQANDAAVAQTRQVVAYAWKATEH